VATQRVHLTLAQSGYDHLRDLASGEVQVEGVDLTVLTLPIVEMFFRFLRYREWDVSELSFAKYLSLRAAGDTSLTAIPVFPSRMCRHSSIFVRPDGPSSPKELAGARIGVPEWAQTASVYTRALLQHEWGIPLQDVSWFQAGVNTAGRVEKVAIRLPDGVALTRVPDRSLDEMLRDGDLDAVFSAQPPASFERGEPHVVRLFPEYRQVEREYMQRTGIFPIMHVVVVRSDVLEGAPWIASNLLSAFSEAKRRSFARLTDIAASRLPLAWVPALVEEMQGLLGADPFPYGVEENRVTLDAFTRWAHEQGVASRLVQPEELFAPQVLEHHRA
jgi:4,5-dihydroxyphthalate decarboxylase